MFEHSDIWTAIDRLAATCGYSPSGLAKKAGLDPTTFNKSKRTSADDKPRWPSTESISKILAVTGMTMTDFFGLIDGAGDKDSETRASLPLLRVSEAGRKGFFDSNGYPATLDKWDSANFPVPEGMGSAANLYALEIDDDSMAPVYRKGDIVVVAPGVTLRKGDRVAFKHKKLGVMAREMTRRTADRIELTALNSAYESLVAQPDDIEWTARILWLSQ